VPGILLAARGRSSRGSFYGAPQPASCCCFAPTRARPPCSLAERPALSLLIYMGKVGTTLRRIDWILFCSVGILAVLGLIAIWSVDLAQDPEHLFNFKKQLVFVIVGLLMTGGLACVDCTSGFRAYRTTVFERVHLDQIKTTGYAFLPELLFNLDGVRVAEVPICYTERRLGESKMSKRVIAEAVMRPWVLLFRRLGRRVRRFIKKERRP